MRNRFAALAAIVALSGGAWLFAQGFPPNARLAAVDVAGVERLDKATLIDATGLRPGASITLADLDAAAARLGQTGLVSEVSYRYTYRGADVTVTFTVAEARLGWPVVFDSFPWFTDQELTRAVAQRLPGFDGRLPDTSDAIDRATEALAEQLKLRGLAGQVGYFPLASPGATGGQHLFRVEGIQIPVCSIEFSGVQPSLATRVREAGKPLLGRQLSRTEAASFLSATIRPIYDELGYLRARVLSATASIGRDAACTPDVVVSAEVQEGLRYTWNGATWSGNPSIASAGLDPLLQFKTGEVANGLKLAARLREVVHAYGRLGYLDAAVDPVPRFDDAAMAASFEMKVTEGAQYHMGSVTVAGAPPETAKRIESRWRLPAGAVFDHDYPTRFLSDLMSADRGLFAGLGKAAVTRHPDPATRIVNVIVSFTPSR
jgi:outer membrane protein assembly factor BamA